MYIYIYIPSPVAVTQWVYLPKSGCIGVKKGSSSNVESGGMIPIDDVIGQFWVPLRPLRYLLNFEGKALTSGTENNPMISNA